MFAALEQRILAPVNRIIKKTLTSLIAAFLGLIFFFIALCFFSFAAYSYVAETQDSVTAALITGGALIGLALIALVTALIMVKSGSKNSAATSQPAISQPASGLKFRTGYPLIDVAQIALPLIMPLREQAHQRIKDRPVSTGILTLATGIIAGFVLLTRRPTGSTPWKGRR